MNPVKHRFRYLVVFLGLACLTSILSNYIIINFTFICMKDDPTGVEIGENGTMHNRYDYSVAEKSAIVWAVAVGTILGTGPINYSYVRYGARIPFFIAGIVSAIATILTPIGAYLGLPYLLALRFAQGLAYSADFAAIGIVCVRWAPLAQTGLFISILTSFSPAATVMTNAASGWVSKQDLNKYHTTIILLFFPIQLCKSEFGWQSAFYAHGAVGFVIFAAWLYFYNDDPQYSKKVSAKELTTIQADKTQAHIERDSFVPYWEICKNRVILTVWINSFFEMTTLILLLTYSPIYFRKVLDFSVIETGMLISLSAVAHMPAKLVSGWLSDRQFLSERIRMWFFNTSSVGLAGFMCVGLAFVPATWKYTSVVLFSIVYTLMGTNCGGFYKCGTFAARFVVFLSVFVPVNVTDNAGKYFLVRVGKF
uniref:MFS domain-containing protein n=1 Tax=Caenorhabditis japonica TaxID=281687 RepID=A0A8R1HPV6_CAEJA